MYIWKFEIQESDKHVEMTAIMRYGNKTGDLDSWLIMHVCLFVCMVCFSVNVMKMVFMHRN